LCDYVPFYFTPYTPMMYNIKTGWNGIKSQHLDDIVILFSSLHHLTKNNVDFVISDRHALLKIARFSKDLTDLEEWIVWDTLRARDFKKDDIEKFERYQAEALAHRHLPLSGLLGIAVRSEAVRLTVQALADKHDVDTKVITKSEWYL